MMNDIKKIIIETCDEMTHALKRQGLMKDNKQTPFQKTEQLLYNYKNFKAAIEDKQEQIMTIQEIGVPQKSKSITSFTGGGSYEIQSEGDKAEDKIQAIESSIVVTRKFISIIDNALRKIGDDPYFGIIQLKYFDEKTREEIAELMGVDVSTITRNKNRLINMLKITLFSDEVIYEIFS
jgi:RNA polymerase sigma factor (sigma-70 family)